MLTETHRNATGTGNGTAILRFALLMATSLLITSAGLAQTNTFPSTGNAGIGTLTPVTGLEIVGSTTNSSAKFGTYEIQSYAINNAWLCDNLYYNVGFRFRAAGWGTMAYFYNGAFLIRNTTGPGSAGAGANPVQRLYVGNDGTVALGGLQTPGSVTGASMVIVAGNVGVGTTTPTSKLDVAGDVNVSGNIAAKYQDVAEWVEASEKIDAGTVVVLDPDRANEVMPSNRAYDTTVAGVISAKPGISLGEASESKVLVATSGRVKVKVDATGGPIKIGDLLVTSEKSGLAMKSNPITVSGAKIHRPGTLIGKALEPLDHGQGEILVLLSMQ